MHGKGRAIIGETTKTYAGTRKIPITDELKSILVECVKLAGEAVMEKPKCKLIGENGNIFNLLAIASKVINNEKAKEMTNRVYNSGSYEEALSIIGEYVIII